MLKQRKRAQKETIPVLQLKKPLQIITSTKELVHADILTNDISFKATVRPQYNKQKQIEKICVLRDDRIIYEHDFIINVTNGEYIACGGYYSQTAVLHEIEQCYRKKDSPYGYPKSRLKIEDDVKSLGTAIDEGCIQFGGLKSYKFRVFDNALTIYMRCCDDVS